MLSSKQHAYLDAMDVDVWQLREVAAPPNEPAIKSAQLKLGPGNGGILLVCATDGESSNRLANDINRTLGRLPVWAWPSADGDTVDLTGAVDDKLFTTVAIFGEELAKVFFDGELPGGLSSANLVLLPSIQDIQNLAEARQTLWATLCRSGMLETA